jgi:hypothetical protein
LEVRRVGKFETELRNRVDEVLHYIWDPIGVRDVPNARDEYSAYIPAVFAMLQRDAAPAEVQAYLTEVATVRMCLGGNDAHSAYVAGLLISWKQKLLRDRPDILG